MIDDDTDPAAPKFGDVLDKFMAWAKNSIIRSGPMFGFSKRLRRQSAEGANGPREW
jgi:hypothetical protein